MALPAAEMGTATIDAVRFGIYSDEEVHKLSVKKITNTQLFMNDVPQPAGLYDPALGPLNDFDFCKTCSQRALVCPGHFGHIDLVQLVYHPLLFNKLYQLLQVTCFSCYHFMLDRKEVTLCIGKLKSILRGDIVMANNLSIDILDCSEDDSYLGGLGDGYGHKDQRDWTSIQLTEAQAVLNNFLQRKSRKCSRCDAKKPSISKHTFGWINLAHMKASDIRDNLIVDRKIDVPIDEEEGDESGSEVEDAKNPDTGVAKNSKNKKHDMHPDFGKYSTSRSLLPSEAKKMLERLWVNEAPLCSFICDIQQYDLHSVKKASMFFLKTLLVAPTKFRPPSKGGGGDAVIEHPQTVALQKVLESNKFLGDALLEDSKQDNDSKIRSWKKLQDSINCLFDSKSAGSVDTASGICQILEKKEGMFRQKMMGKRVNFACRSVISPDPYLAVNEIGIPPVFAVKLTYPERVTPWNMSTLREAIVNGPDIHPGATHYIDKTSTMRLPSSKQDRTKISRKLPSSKGILTQPGKSLHHEYEGKVVSRHLRNGDIVLVNRQPTLHKPSIIALKVRVLPGEKTIRFHYANCDSFNADFDGDEINVHFPQDEISRSEAYNIVNADNQYIVPTRGDPKRALIQDHIVSAVLLTKRDTFLSWDEFSELLYASGVCSSSTTCFNSNPGKRVSVLDSEDVLRAHPPAIVRPRKLWTGKQVISAILNHITRGCLPFTVKKRAKIAREYFGKDESKQTNVEGVKRKGKKTLKDTLKTSKSTLKKDLGGTMMQEPSQSVDEDVVLVYKNELVQGIIDKEQFGKYGLVHTVQELYGSSAAGNLLSVLSRVFTAYLQMHGFTCGVDDLLLIQPYDKQRKQLLEVSLNSGEEVHMQFIGRENEQLDSSDMQREIEKAIRRNGESAVALLDGMMRSKLNTLNSSVTKLFPEGLNKPFRANCLSLMTLSGAKGGTFNFQQISLLLGQQELEGKRVPRMVSGKTLPCFPPWDSSARSGGFISNRYLTGLRPQEFYFHCMAGREGLVDTAVKTSRSGYLQRCLIKNLECLKVHYDYTVRDADGSVIQFRYGEDGVDVHKKNFLQEFEALASNRQLIIDRNPFVEVDDSCVSKFIDEDNEFPNQLAVKAVKFSGARAKEGYFGLSHPDDQMMFVNLVRNKYFTSLAQPGEPVGVIAAQSVGEPSTQMTLNTFHHAGRGEMNVTLGIPRLQEILMTASMNIKTPTMTCPLLKTKEKVDGERLAAKLKRITVADLLEKMEVSIVPFTVDNNTICSIYKLKMKLYGPELYPPHTAMTLEDCHHTLRVVFLPELENALGSHLKLLDKISGITESQQESDATERDVSQSNQSLNDDDDDNDVSDDESENTGSDSQKGKRNTSDEIEYEDGEEVAEGRPEDEHVDEPEDEHLDEPEDEHVGEVELEENGLKEDYTRDNVQGTPSQPDSEQSGKRVAVKSRKDAVNACYVDVEGLRCEIHFKLPKKTHILLAQIAERTAKKVFVKTAGNIEQCKVVELHLDDSKAGGIPMLRKGKESRSALQTAGVDFAAFWEMQDELDVRYISSNDIHAVLRTYGVEAARATIIKEIFTVFGYYGVTVDMRHLTLIADYMTHTGNYRPMSRVGGIAESISAFSKMSFETASKFLTEAATHGMVDSLETPSARICVGLPAKVGTGCFDLMHQIDV